MISRKTKMAFTRITQIPLNKSSITGIVLRSLIHTNPSEIETITKIITQHPFPAEPLRPILVQHVPSSLLTATVVEAVLARLFLARSNALKSLEFFEFSLRYSRLPPGPGAVDETLRSLVRAGYFDAAWALMRKIKRVAPGSLTLNSMSIVMLKVAEHRWYEDTIEAFRSFEVDIFSKRKFGTPEFNVLLQAFCLVGRMKGAQRVFTDMHPRFLPDGESMNILLAGFRDKGDLESFELFYNGLIVRGFKPNDATYGVRIDAYCKEGRLADALKLVGEMESLNMSPSLAMLTSLIHGAAKAGDVSTAREIFEGFGLRNLSPDTAAYNAYIHSFVSCKDLKSALAVMDEMDEKRVPCDNTTYHTLFLGMIRALDFDGVSGLSDKMMERNFIPEENTLLLLMKFFSKNSRLDLGWQIWGYLLDKGYCPYGHPLDILLTGLCSRGLADEAFECSKQVLERGNYLTVAAFRMVEMLLLRKGHADKLTTLKDMTSKLRTHLPPPHLVSDS